MRISLRRTSVIPALLLFAALPRGVAAQAECPRATLSAYSHNDYRNARPLWHALQLGFRGVEADVFLIDGVLRLGHSRKEATRGPSLEKAYLEPIAKLVSACGTLTADEGPFLLAIEIKQQSQTAHDSLAAALSRYPGLQSGGSSGRMSVQVVLVGWRLPPPPTPDTTRRALSLDHPLTNRQRMAAAPPAGRERLLSLDYGKTIDRFWLSRRDRCLWLTALAQTKQQNPGALLRAYNVPRHAGIYAALLDAGVDLIGVKDLSESRNIADAGSRGTLRALPECTSGAPPGAKTAALATP